MAIETKDASGLQFADYNPREISEHDFGSLQFSMDEYGDLSGITNNIRTNTLVTGHQRLRGLFAKYKDKVVIEITERFAMPDDHGTVARGFVSITGTTQRFNYREVDWPAEKEKTANVIANRAQGEFDQQKLADLTAELHAIDPGLVKHMGNTDREIKRLLQMSSAPEDQADDDQKDDTEKLTFSTTAQQRDVILKALEITKSTNQIDQNYPPNEANGAALYYMAQAVVDQSGEQ
jgi:hypothetical protein